jgi:hypothetical protein
MPRYAIGRKPRCDWIDDDGPMIPSLTVDEHWEVDTGLIAVTGEPIMRLPNAIGFHAEID